MPIAPKPKVNPTVTAALPTPSKKPSVAKKTKLPTIRPAAVKTTLVATVRAKAAPKPKAAKPVKPKKPKLVRDSFTIPKAEYAVLDDLKQRAARLASPAKKSELLRAGIKALAAMPDAAFAAALGVVPAIKTGRPSKA